MVATLEREPVDMAEERAGFDRMATLLRHFVRWMREHRDRVQLSYLIPERSGFGWYVIAKQPAFDFALSKELTEFGFALIRKGFPIHATLLPGSVDASVPTDGIAISSNGEVATYAG